MPSLLSATEQSATPSIDYNDDVNRSNSGDQIVSNENNYSPQTTPTNSSIYDRLNSGNSSLTSVASAGFGPATALEQYRLQLYNYALHMERLRYAPQDHTQHQAQQQQQQRQQAYNISSSVSSPNVYSATAYVPGNRLALSMSLFPQHIFKPEDPKPQHSYIGLIAMAILSSPELKLVLSDIYQYILDNYPYFRTRGPGWRNSIRHNLSLNDCFVKSGRSANGKGHYWAIHPANMDDFRKGDFRRRKAQRKVRKHMGLSVDDAGTDSPSPPPLDLSSPPPPTVTASLHSSHPPHPFTVAQQLAAFGYLHQQQQRQQQQQQHPNVMAQPLMSHQYNFRPLAARYYITAASSPAGNLPYNAVHQRMNNQISGNTLKGSSATASVIANLYSQTRKRQFDVASLLAPDVEVAISDDHDAEMQETTTTTTTTTTLDVEAEVAGNTTTQLQQTVITKLTLNHQCNHNNNNNNNNNNSSNNISQQHQSHQSASFSDHSTVDEQNEEIDVVDVDAQSNVDSNEDGSQHIEEWHLTDSNVLKDDRDNQIVVNDETTQENIICCTNNSSRNSPTEIFDSATNVDDPVECRKSLENPSEDDIQQTAPCIADPTQDQMTLEEHYLIGHNNNNNNNNFNHSNSSMDPYVFGRYYGTYMAAAARRLHVGSAYNQ